MKSVFVCAGIVSTLAFAATSHAALVTAGELVVNLTNSGLSGSSNTWVNESTDAGSVGNFAKRGSGNLNVVTQDGFTALGVQTTSANSLISAGQVPASIAGNGSFSLEVWLNAGGNLYSTFSSQNTFAEYGADQFRQDRRFSYSANESGSGAFAGNFNDLKYPTNPPATGWHMVNFTYDSTNNLLSLYVDGSLFNSGTLATMATPQSVVYLGSNLAGGNPFSGYLAAVRLETGVLSAADIAGNFQAGLTASPAVPEPAALTLAGLAMGGLLVRRRAVLA